VLGPWIVTKDELTDPYMLKSEHRAQSNVSLMRLRVVPSGRDGTEEYGDFSAFSP